jgi:hypothetical protein
MTTSSPCLSQQRSQIKSFPVPVVVVQKKSRTYFGSVLRAHRAIDCIVMWIMLKKEGGECFFVTNRDLRRVDWFSDHLFNLLYLLSALLVHRGTGIVSLPRRMRRGK